MTGQIPDHGTVLEQICAVAGASPTRALIERLVA
jgi:hypothetical protein